jgi:hypothetical protein
MGIPFQAVAARASALLLVDFTPPIQYPISKIFLMIALSKLDSATWLVHNRKPYI